MHPRNSNVLAIALVLASVGCTSAPPIGTAPGPAPPAELAEALEARAARHAPGPEHRALAALAGDWAVAVEAPDGARIGAGRATIDAVHGGRWTRIALEIELSGEAATLTGYLGFDRVAGEYQALWLSDLSSGMSLLRGRGALGGQGLVLEGASAEARGAARMRLTNAGELVVETLGPGPDGRPRLLRRSRYTRVTR